MEQIVSTFHLDWKIIIAQLINFAVVVGVLWYFAFKPLAKTMMERTTKIEKGLEAAAAAQEKLEQIEKKRQAALAETKKEAQQLINQASDLAEKQKREIVQKTKEEAAKVVALAREQIKREKQNMIGEVKAEVATLIIQAAEKILPKITDKKIDKALIENTLRELK